MSDARHAHSPPRAPLGHAPLVLIIEDEEPIRRFLRATLEANNFRVKESSTARDGVLQAVTVRPDLILLDLGLPDGDGLNVTRTVRTESGVPIVVLSARGQESDKVSALDAGADDYLTKPFGVGELLARIRVALRHSALSGTGGTAGDSSAPKPYESTIDGRTLRVDTVARVVHVTDDERPPRGAPDADGVQAPGVPRQARGQGADAPDDLEGGLGPATRRRCAVPSRLRRGTPQEARGRPRPAAPHHHRARRGISHGRERRVRP